MFPKFWEHLGNTEFSPSSPKLFGEQEHCSQVPQNYLGNGNIVPMIPKNIWGTGTLFPCSPKLFGGQEHCYHVTQMCLGNRDIDPMFPKYFWGIGTLLPCSRNVIWGTFWGTWEHLGNMRATNFR